MPLLKKTDEEENNSLLNLPEDDENLDEIDKETTEIGFIEECDDI